MSQKRAHKKLRLGVRLESLKVDLGETLGGGNDIFGMVSWGGWDGFEVGMWG